MIKAKMKVSARFAGFWKKVFNPQKPKEAVVGLRSLSQWKLVLFKKRTATVKSSLKDFRSGSPSTTHSLRMFWQWGRSVFWIVVILFILLWVLCFFLNSEVFDRYLVFEALDAYREGILGGKRATHWLLDENQQPIEVVARDLIKHPRTVMSLEACFKALKLGARHALFFSLLFLALFGIYFDSKQRQSLRDSTEEIPSYAEDLGQDLDPSPKVCACKSTILAPVESLEIQPLSDTDTVEGQDQIPMHSQRAMRSERKEPCVCCQDPDLTYPACAASSELCQVSEKAAVFKDAKGSFMKP